MLPAAVLHWENRARDVIADKRSSFAPEYSCAVEESANKRVVPSRRFLPSRVQVTITSHTITSRPFDFAWQGGYADLSRDTILAAIDGMLMFVGKVTPYFKEKIASIPFHF